MTAGAQSGHAPGARRLTVTAGLLSLLVFSAIAGSAADQVSIWIDEAVQMVGLQLAPAQRLTFDRTPSPVGTYLPDDFVPPLSYWLGRSWARVFGLSELSLRWHGICLVGLACLITAATGARVGGVAGALLGALWLSTSPNAIIYAITIRYYPLLILCSACSLHCFVRRLQQPQHRWWTLALTASLIGAVFTHAYGLVLAGSLWALILFEERRRPQWTTLVGISATAAAALVLWPVFAAAISDLGGSSTDESPWYLTARLLFRAISHATLMTSLPVAVSGAVATLTVFAMVALPRYRASQAGRFTLTALALGLTTTMAAIVLHLGLVAQEPRYAMWTLPAVAIAVASVGSLERGARWIGIGAALLAVAANVYGATLLTRHAPLFWFGNYKQLARAARCSDLAADAIIHNHGRGSGFVYASIYHYVGAGLAQYASDGLSDGAVQVLPARTAWVEVDELQAHCIAVITSRFLNTDEIRRLLQGKKPLFPVAPVAERLRLDQTWQLEHETEVYSYVASRVSVFRRRR